MPYTKHHILQILICSAAIGAIAALFSSISDRYDVEVVQGFDAPPLYRLATTEQPLIIPLPQGEKAISGIVVYAGNNITAKNQLDVQVQNAEGESVAKKSRQSTYYKQDGLPAMHIFLQKKRSSKKEQLFLSIKPYAEQELAFIATPEQHVVYSLIYKEPVSSATKQGVLVGTALAFSLLLLHYVQIREKWQWVGAALIICVFSILATLPYLYRLGDWGIYDWDYRHSLSHIYQTTIREYHQFPFWNPYICGGTAGLGDPEFAIVTPSFLLQFIFGVENGTGIALSLGFGITGLGMLFLARSLKLGVLPALTSAIICAFSSALLLKATEGHTTIIFAYMWEPWVFWAWLRAKPLLCGIFLTFALLQGGIYILSYTFIAFAALCVLSPNKRKALTTTIYAGAWMIGLSAFQLIPSLFWVREFPDTAFVGSAYTFTNQWDIFFGRYLQNMYVLQNQVSRWHEYGAYIGYGVLALVLLGISYVRTSRTVRMLLVGIIASLTLSSLGPFFEPFLNSMQFLPRSNISRLVLFTVLCGSLIAGFGMKKLMFTLSKRYRFIAIIIVGFIAIDLMSINYPIAQEGFAIPQVTEHISPAPWPLAHSTEQYEIRHNGSDIPRTYAAILKGYGTSSFCSVIGPKSAVTTGEYIQPKQNVQTKLTSWSPNTIVFDYDSPNETDITVNTNYAKGWQTSHGHILKTNPLLTVHVPAGKSEVKVQYQPPGFILGSILSLATLIVGIILVFAARPSSN